MVSPPPPFPHRYFASFMGDYDSGRRAREAFFVRFNTLTQNIPLHADEDLQFVIHTRIVSCFHCFVVLSRCVAGR